MKKETANKQGKNWFIFYVYIRPILAVLLNAQNTVILLKAFSNLPYYGQVYTIGVVLSLVLNVILWLLAAFQSKKTIKLIYCFLIYETLFIPMSASINETYSDTESILIYFILVAILALCWLLPNHIYFRKRKWIFQEDKAVTICKKCNNKILKKETTCPCCKNKIANNSKSSKKEENIFICSNCKSEVSKSSKFCPNCGESFESDSEPKNEINSLKEKTDNTDMDKKYSDLNKLKELLDKEIITKEEFEKEKRKILNK